MYSLLLDFASMKEVGKRDDDLLTLQEAVRAVGEELTLVAAGNAKPPKGYYITYYSPEELGMNVGYDRDEVDQLPHEFEEKDVELVMAQCNGVSRNRVISALRDSEGDIVNAIMALTLDDTRI